jgi:hypothetical protein
VLNWLSAAIRLPDHGWCCTATVVWLLLICAAARQQSLSAACVDRKRAPSDQALFDALRAGLPSRIRTLEQRLVAALHTRLPRSVTRRARQVAIDWHLIPYHGEPYAHDNELYHSAPKSGTTKFHAYATACVVEHGRRYTVALTWVRRRESVVTVLQRLWPQMQQIGLKIKLMLLDRQFFSGPVMKWLISQRQPFLMPVVLRGRKPKTRRRATGLRAIRQQPAGWYAYTHGAKTGTVSISICVAYKTYTDRHSETRQSKKLLFAAWGVRGSPREICQRYRRRFGIESSYRQLKQARIRTCTRDPKLRLLFVGVALVLRNVWVWLHATLLAKSSGEHPELRLHLFRFRRLLDWLVLAAAEQLHDRSPPSVDYN